jgi:hypothetical protein
LPAGTTTRSSESDDELAADTASRSEQAGSLLQPPATLVSAVVLTVKLAAWPVAGENNASATATQTTDIDFKRIPCFIIDF